MRIYFVRHGQSNYNLRDLCNSNPKIDVHLTKLGIEQAENVGKTLKNKNIDIVFVSELLRTKQTAETINKHHNAEIKIDKRLNDRKTGFEGKSYFDYRKAIEKDPFHKKPKGGESFQEEKNRVFSFLDHLIKRNYKTVLVVSHEEIMKIVKGYFEKLTDEEMWDVRVPNGYIMEFEI